MYAKNIIYGERNSFYIVLTTHDTVCYNLRVLTIKGVAMDLKEVNKLATKAVKSEQELSRLEDEFKLKSPELAKFLKNQEEKQKKVNELWDKVKQALIDSGYTDVIENEYFKISVSKVLNIKVPDPELLEDEFKKMVIVPEMDAIKNHAKLYNELPEGCVDASFYRLNKKIK